MDQDNPIATLSEIFHCGQPLYYYGDLLNVYREPIDSHPKGWESTSTPLMKMQATEMINRISLIRAMMPDWALAMKQRANERALNNSSLSKRDKEALESGL